MRPFTGPPPSSAASMLRSSRFPTPPTEGVTLFPFRRMKSKVTITLDGAMLMSSTPEPRLVPDMPLPPYAHVPGRTPHPISDPRGHSFGARHELPDAPDEKHWQQCRAYQYGIDLFNHGYYWEAHEAWEGLWHACGRGGRMGSFL